MGVLYGFLRGYWEFKLYVAHVVFKVSLLPFLLPYKTSCNPKFGLRFRDILGIMEKKMETAIVYWGYIGNNGKKMEATIVFRV